MHFSYVWTEKGYAPVVFNVYRDQATTGTAIAPLTAAAVSMELEDSSLASARTIVVDLHPERRIGRFETRRWAGA